ncbi:MAG: hypothetical protein MJ200_00865 [Mycoplasmoidaceae bacterium]|nr:hypothetical protein [Mycoplasmoidaceae bacterium]
MKKAKKIILPIATVATVAGVIAPLVVACNKDQGPQYDVTVQKVDGDEGITKI